MASRFVTVTAPESADFVADNIGFKYVDLTPEREAMLRAEAAKYYVAKVETQVYDHDDYGSYETVSETCRYTVTEVKSLSEKIWLRGEGACDLITDGDAFLGVVCFTGFTDYRGLESNGFIPLRHLNDRTGLTEYCHAAISVLSVNKDDLPQSTRSALAGYDGRVEISYRTSFYLAKT